MAADPRIQAAFLAACKAELAALKPGNVHRYGDGHGMTVADFQASAAAAAPCIASTGSSVGERILAATEATWATVGCNTNLGIVLLCAPLAIAAEKVIDRGDPLNTERLRIATHVALDDLTVADAALAYRAIARANPGGLGLAASQDVRDAPTVTLLAAMELAVEHDRIAHQYATDFADIFNLPLPLLLKDLAAGRNLEEATTGIFLTMLAKWPDSHLLRKFGDSAAQTVSTEARNFSDRYRNTPWPTMFEHLLAWDSRLKALGLNPGTTADLTVATLFVHRLLDDRYSPSMLRA